MKNKLKKHMLENGQTTFKKSKDGKNLRIVFWKAKKVKAYGTVFFLNGHREFIEKYSETFQFFLKKGFNVITLIGEAGGFLTDHSLQDPESNIFLLQQNIKWT